MFTLTRKTDYAIIALSHMAQHPDSICTAREMSDRFHLPPALLMNVLKTMSQQELIRSIRGARGGYQLALPAAQVSLADIITAVEGPIRFVQCTGQAPAEECACELLDFCPVKGPVQMIHDRLEDFLSRITLADIVRAAEDGGQSVGISVEGQRPRSSSLLATDTAIRTVH